MDTATQIPMFNTSRLICMICDRPGAIVPHNQTLPSTYVWRGETKHVVAYGFRHPDCSPEDETAS